MKRNLALIIALLFSFTARAQTCAEAVAANLVLGGGTTDCFTNYVNVTAQSNSSGGIEFSLPGTLGSNGNMLTTNGAGVLSWTAPLDGSTFLLKNPALTSRNVTQGTTSSVVPISLEAFGSGSAHLLDFQNSSGTPIAWFDHSAILTVPEALVKSIAQIGEDGGATGQLDMKDGITHGVSILPAAPTTDWVWTLPPNGGANNYFMKTDGAGTATWADPSSVITGFVKTNPAASPDNVVTGLTTITPLTPTIDNLTSQTKYPGILLTNTTAATSLAPRQWSPALELHSVAYNTAAAASQNADWFIQSKANNGADSIEAVLAFSYRRNNTSNPIQMFTLSGSYGADLAGFQLHTMADPTSAQDAATKAYVDAQISGGSGIGAAVILAPSVSSRNYIQQTGSGAVSVTIQQKASASDNFLDLRKSDGTLLGAWQSDGSIAILGAGLQLVDPSSLSSITIKQPTLASAWNLTLPTNDGGAFDLLSSDGSGTTQWVNIAAGAGMSYSASGSTITLTNTMDGSVPNAGTGKSSFTAYAVITGGTTSTGALQNVSGVGTSGQVLTSNGAGALPTWQAGGSSGTVTNVATDATLTGGPITTTGTLGINLTHSNTWGGASPAVQTFASDGLGASGGVDVIEYANRTASTSLATVQTSPAPFWVGHAWNTTATAADNAFSFREWMDLTSAAAPTGTLTWQFSNATVNPGTWTTGMTLKSAGVNKGATLTLPLSAIATTVTDALVIDNQTAATSGVPAQISGQLRFQGTARNSVSGLSETNYISMYANQTNAAGATSEQLIFNRNLNGGGDIELARITSAGDVSALNGFVINHATPTNKAVMVSNGTRFLSGSVDLTSSAAVTGTLPIANGGLGFTTGASQDIVFFSGTNVINKKSIGANHTYLGSDGSSISYKNDIKDFIVGNAMAIGDMYVGNSSSGTNLTKITVGPTGTLLTSRGSGNTPTWQYPAVPLLGQATTLPNVTRYVFPIGQATLSATLTTSTEFVAPRAYTLRNLYVAAGAAPGALQTTIVTVYVNGSAGNETITLNATDTFATDAVNTDNISAGDLVTLQIVTSTTSAATTLTYGIEVSNQ